MEFVCLSIAAKLDLALVGKVFAAPQDSPWRGCLCVGGEQLDVLLGTRNRGRKLYLFRSGCVVFQGFSNGELLMMLKHLSASVAPIRYQQVVEYREVLESGQLGYDEEKDIPALEAVVPHCLAKSVELSLLTDELVRHLECEEVLIERLRQGKTWLNLRYTSAARIRLILFQCRALSHASLLESRVHGAASAERAISAKLDEALGLTVRTGTFYAKLENLNALLARFSSEKLATSMIRFYSYEVYLLAIFPILHFVPSGASLLQGISRLWAWVASLLP